MHYSFSFLFCKQSKQVANLHLIEIESLRIAYSEYYLGLTTDIALLYTGKCYFNKC